MPSIGRRCHELRIQDESATRCIAYRADPDGIAIADILAKNTQKTSKKYPGESRYRGKGQTSPSDPSPQLGLVSQINAKVPWNLFMKYPLICCYQRFAVKKPLQRGIGQEIAQR